MSKTDWTREWPREDGHYWFYGCPFGRREMFAGAEIEPELVHLKSRSGLIIGQGHFWYPEEGADGWFRPIDLPDLPKALWNALSSGEEE